MSDITDKIFADVCLDERITDGIFRMEEEQHMNALRDYFVKKGLTKEDSIHITNRMLEGKYPDRQAYRKEDGILVTWPSPKHKKKAMQENPGKYVEENPNPKKEEPKPEKEEPKMDVSPDEDEAPVDDMEKNNQRRPNNLFGSPDGLDNAVVQQGNQNLKVEPVRGPETTMKPAPVVPQPSQPVQKTPQRIAAEKEVAAQILQTDDSTLSNISSPLDEQCIHQLNELYKKANEWGFQKAVTFLTKYVKS